MKIYTVSIDYDNGESVADVLLAFTDKARAIKAAELKFNSMVDTHERNNDGKCVTYSEACAGREQYEPHVVWLRMYEIDAHCMPTVCVQEVELES